jgi:hypothetical protein
MLAEVRADLQHLLLTEIGDGVDRVELSDFGQRGLLTAAADDISRIDQVLADNAVERCSDFCVTQVQLGDCHLCLSVEQRCFGARPFEGPMIDLSLGRGILLDELCVTDELGFCICQRGLSGEHLGLRLLQLILVLVLLDRKEKVALFDELAILVVDFLEIAFDTCDQLDRIYRRGIAGDLDIAADTLRLRFYDRDGLGCLRRDLRLHDRGNRRRIGRYLRLRRRRRVE